MWVLGRFLPLMVGHFVPEDDQHWLNYIRLVEISKYLFSPAVDEDNVACLDVLITEHHRSFLELYSHVHIIPKMHYLLHTPRLILQ